MNRSNNRASLASVVNRTRRGDSWRHDGVKAFLHAMWKGPVGWRQPGGHEALHAMISVA